jgi:hypothetical protein
LGEALAPSSDLIAVPGTGRSCRTFLPDVLIRSLVGILVIAIGVRYLWAGLN